MTALANARRLAEMIRVDHAGEHGAVRIYDGQKAVFDKIEGKEEMVELVAHMAEQEQEHLAYFDALMSERDIRPTVLSPFWDMAGFTLGAVTALMGEKAAMACTAAVETEIDAHYAAQLEALAIARIKPIKLWPKRLRNFAPMRPPAYGFRTWCGRNTGL